MTITGSGFSVGGDVDRVFFAGTTGSNLQVISDSVLKVDTPAGTGAVNVTVLRSNTSQAAIENNGFLYLSGSAPAPLLLVVQPALGPDTGGVTITLSGSAFQTGATVRFGGTPATNNVVHSAVRMSCTLPAGSLGTVTVAIQNPDSQTAQISGGFQYVTNPAVSSVSPTTSWTTGGSLVTVTGTNFAPGATVLVGGSALTGVTFVSSTQLTGTTSSHPAGLVGVTVYNVGQLVGSLGSVFTYLTSADAQTAAFNFDTANGIDCRRRWYVNLNAPSFLKDLQNQGLQSWGVAGDNTQPPAQPTLVDALALDWTRAYVLSTMNVIYGRNGDGTAISGTSISITFVGLAPTIGARGCLSPSNDWSEMCVGGCDPLNGGPHPIANQTCGLAALGRSNFDQNAASGCNVQAEQSCNGIYHSCTGCSWPASGSLGSDGVFAGVIGTQWIAGLTGGRLRLSDQPYLDGTITFGMRYSQIHDFIRQFAYRIAYVTAHEIGHSVGLVASSTSGTCSASGGLCSAGPEHNACCATNVMQAAASLGGTFSQTGRAFSGQPGSVSAASTCYTSGVSSWALLKSFCGTSP